MPGRRRQSIGGGGWGWAGGAGSLWAFLSPMALIDAAACITLPHAILSLIWCKQQNSQAPATIEVLLWHKEPGWQGVT